MHKIIGKIDQGRESKNLFITVFLNFGIAIAELIGGIFANSLALISDALHNLSDGVALLITYITVKISRKEPTKRRTFGYKRIQILAALFNAVMLVGICVFLLFEAYERLVEPQEVNSVPMLIVATIGLLANIYSVYLIKDFQQNNLNIRSAYVHLIGDTVSSVAVIVGGVLIYLYNMHWVDPVITVLISLWIIRASYKILEETYNILMQAAPKSIDIEMIRRDAQKIKGVKDIHHVHVWSLTDQEVHFEAHIELDADYRLSESQHIYAEMEKLLHDKYDIEHVTMQLEYGYCKNNNLLAT